ncbi:FATTY-ACID-BINDING PROTEIN 1 [Salix purpurea]|uniref:FATTY-ACID-BINDING PROTEIN 1 n=1 Tax=Salix purpurea TaxID=77065 RepID=A0A9Q0WUT7_SALPP|nr:FATTY-ACID-BINDING PROTEIN 1 [Salix purpurea]
MCHNSNGSAGAGAFVGMETTHNSINPKTREHIHSERAAFSLLQALSSAPARVSLPLADSSPSVVRAKTGASFPASETFGQWTVYRKLRIRSARSAFEESVGSRLERFGEPDYELTQM